VNVRLIPVTDRGVEYPVIKTVKLVAVCPVTWTLVNTGATGAMVTNWFVWVTGVMAVPVAATLKDGVIVMVPTTVPVWNCAVVAPLVPNTAVVVFAGIVKLTVNPPLENWIAGSMTTAPELKDKLSVPESASGYGADNVRPING